MCLLRQSCVAKTRIRNLLVLLLGHPADDLTINNDRYSALK